LAHRERYLRLLTVGLAAAVSLEAAWLAIAVIGPNPSWQLGMDFRYYADLGHRWLVDGSYYLPRQLDGPYVAGLLEQAPVVDTLYPPSALILFVPFTWLQPVFWWALPIVILGGALRRLEPAPWAWPVILALMLWPRAIGAYLFGNTDIWIVALVAAGLAWGWPAIALVIKPTFAPLALLGLRDRRWWLCLGIGLAFTALSWPLWLDYLTAMRNARGLDLGYSLGSAPLVLSPMVAWLASPRRWVAGRLAAVAPGH
jgi:hypothetical protein